jgi:ribosomal-protein-alanine N-acetyltransferase
VAVIETERLLLREFVPEDLELLAPIFADAEMMRFYPAPFTRERSAGWIAWAMALYAERGHGLWAMVRRDDNLFLGDCGLVPQQIEGAELLEIGYHVRRDQWGRGYAPEAAAACRDYAFGHLGVARVCSIVDPLNLASRRVAERVHTQLRMFHWQRNNREMCLYFSERPDDPRPAGPSGS